MKKIIIDTDMGPNNWMTILYLLKHPAVQVDGICACGTGISHLNPAVENISKLLKVCDYETGIYPGSPTTFDTGHQFGN